MNEYTPELSVVGIVGFLVPFVVSLINRPNMKSSTRRWVSVGVSVLLALVALMAVGGFTDMRVDSPQQVVIVILGVLGVAQFVYSALQTTVPRVLPTIEVKTSPHDSTVEPGSYSGPEYNTLSHGSVESEQQYLGNDEPKHRLE